MKFETRPCTIEAIQWVDNTTEIKEFCGNNATYEVEDSAWQVGKGIPHETLTIHTIDGDIKAQRGDFIIKGLNGEFYPCKHDIFIKKYKPQGLDAYINLRELHYKYITYEELNNDIIDFLNYINQKHICGFANYKLENRELKNGKSTLAIDKGTIMLILQQPKNKEDVFITIEKNKYFLFNDKLYITKDLMEHILDRGIDLGIKLCSEQ